MSHFAQLDENNVVVQVITVANEVLQDGTGVENEQLGIDFCKKAYGDDTRWVQTSYNANKRRNYAVVGGTYHPDLDAFVGLKPWDSWTLNTETCQWQAPVEMPHDGKPYYWNEAKLEWVEIILEE